jgi:HD superfamily phosphohydrolase YqeK
LFNIDLFDEEIEFPMIIHQKLSKEFAKLYFGVQDTDILNAISCHTTLRSNPTKLDMIVFLADKISWDQEGKPPYLELIMNGLETSLELGTLNFVTYLVENRKSLRVVHSWLLDAYNELSKVPPIVLSDIANVKNGH